MSAEPRQRRADPIGRVVASNLRRLRGHAGLTQAELAERLAPYMGGEVSASAISQWEEGRSLDRSVRRYSITELWAMCRVFQIPLSGLLLPGVFSVPHDEIPTTHLFGEDYFQVWKDCFAKTGDYETMWHVLEFFEAQHRLVWEDRLREGDRPDHPLLAGMSDTEIDELRQVLEVSPKFQAPRGAEDGDGDR